MTLAHQGWIMISGYLGINLTLGHYLKKTNDLPFPLFSCSFIYNLKTVFRL